MDARSDEITILLQAWSRGEPDALSELIARVEPELRKIARFYFRQEDGDHTLQPTALVGEVCLRLMGWRTVRWDSREQFFSWVGLLMRRLLIDHAHRRKSQKRGGRVKMLSLTGASQRAAASGLDPAYLLDLGAALEKLNRIDPEAARVVDLKFFAGLSSEESARVLGLSRATVNRRWKAAKLLLARELGDPAVS